MKKIFTLILFCLTVVFTQAEIFHPGKWTFSTEKLNDKEYVLVFKIKLEEGWHMYSLFTPDGGSLPTVFTFDSLACFSRIGKVSEPKPHIEFDSLFMVEVYSFLEREVTFKQKIQLKGSDCTIKGNIDFQACKQLCINENTPFSFTIKTKDAKAAAPDTTGSTTGIPDEIIVSNPVVNSSDTQLVAAQTPGKFQLEEGCGAAGGGKKEADRTLLAIFIAGMLGGLLALLTPCVFPMIPMTVSFFTKKSGSRAKAIRNALIYAFSIIFIYVGLGLLVTVSFGSDALNDLASNVYFNLAFFVIFVLFAISFFGAFEITLPSWIINKADSASDKGGLIGIFFMAFTLCLVSFSCTGPIIGTLLVEAAHGRSYLGPLAGMTGFSFALAIPFALFSLFPNWLNSLPKSGGWLNTVKVSLGFIELALALKFLSNVDLAYHWGFLQRELFISIWVVIFVMFGFYILGKIKLSHDNDLEFISVGRLMFSVLIFTFSLYLIPGIFGAPLKLISGFPPPEFYKEWKTGKVNECPHDLNCFHDYDEGMAYAKVQGKPVLIDFTGWACVNCRKMEDKVWSDPKVLKRLAEDYVLISLYVDDKTELAPEKQYVSSVTGKKIKTTGNKWSELEANVYQTNSQPYYVLIDNKERPLAEPKGFTPDIPTYLAFLDEGLCRYKNRH